MIRGFTKLLFATIVVAFIIIAASKIVSRIPNSEQKIGSVSIERVLPNLSPSSGYSTTAPTTTTPTATSTPSSGSTGSSSVTGSQSIGNASSNWAGYVSTGGTFTTVSGSWTVPSATSSDFTAADAAWIGIGGIASNDLIQVGTQEVISPTGQSETSAFYEMLPDASQTITDININPGDNISATISELSTGEWNITLTDNTNGESSTNTVNYDSTNSSAEWIEEDPSNGETQVPLDDFGSISFSNGSTTENGSNESIFGSGGQAVNMINPEDETLATTSALGGDGGSFSVTRSSADSVSAVSEFNNNFQSWVRRGDGISRELKSDL